MEHPKISVIVPVYNAENYLHRCVDSILAQTFTDFELWLVDDGSPDRSGEICDEYARKDRRVKVAHKENGGVSSARNVGLECASGEWICFVDSDDYVDPDYLTTLYVKDLPCSSIVMMNYWECLDVKSFRASGPEMVKRFIDNQLIQESGPCCKLFNLDILRINNIEFDVNIHMGEDGVFLLRYLCCIDNMIHLENKNLYHYVYHAGSLSTKYYTFESEYECFLLWIKYLQKYITKYGEVYDAVDAVVWRNRGADAFLRAIQSLSRHVPPYGLKDTMRRLRNIPKKYTDNFGLYYETSLFRRKINRMLISRRCWWGYWLYTRLDFFFSNKTNRL